MKTIIFCSAPKFLWFFRWFSIYVRSSFADVRNSRSVFVKDDVFSASDYRYCDHLASCIEEELVSRMVAVSSSAFLSNWGGGNYADYFLSSGIVEHARDVYESFNYANQVKKKYGITSDVYIFPLNFSLKIYKEMKAMGLIPEGIKIHFVAKVYIQLYNSLKFLYFFARMLIYPEIVAFKARNQTNFKKYSYDCCAYLDDGLLGEELANNKVFSLFNSRNTLYVDDRFRKFQLWPKRVKALGLNVLRLEDVVKEIDIVKYLKKIYRFAFVWRYRMFKLLVRYPFLVKQCSRAVRERILWEIFYNKFDVNRVIRMMVKENLTSSIVHKKNNTKTIFIYFSTTMEIVAQPKKMGVSTCHDYSHMMFDSVISSKVSNNWFKTQKNHICEYIEIGPVFTELVYKAKNNRSDLRKGLGIASRSKVISFLDHTVGYRGVLTFESYKLFIDSMLTLASENPDICFLFKGKKNVSIMKSIMGDDYLNIVQRFKRASNIVYIDNSQLTSFDVVGMSDLVVSAPMSSVIFESLCGGVRAISFDPLKQYTKYDIFTNNLANFNATSYSHLSELVDYWVYQCTDVEFNDFLQYDIWPNVGLTYYDDSRIGGVREVLNI